MLNRNKHLAYICWSVVLDKALEVVIKVDRLVWRKYWYPIEIKQLSDALNDVFKR